MGTYEAHDRLLKIDKYEFKVHRKKIKPWDGGYKLKLVGKGHWKFEMNVLTLEFKRGGNGEAKKYCVEHYRGKIFLLEPKDYDRFRIINTKEYSEEALNNFYIEEMLGTYFLQNGKIKRQLAF